jgi:hypothetical protein
MKVVAELVEKGDLPLAKADKAISWDPFNLYRSIDSFNLIDP